MKIAALLFALLICSMQSSSQVPEKQEQQSALTKADVKLGYKIIEAPGNTWGYDIYKNDRLFIHQPSIPALPGNKGFTSKAAAEKVAKKIIQKIKNGESLPTITVDEMKQLGAIPKQ